MQMDLWSNFYDFVQASDYFLIWSLLLLLLGWGLLFFQEFLQIYIVGLLLFLKDVSGTKS